MPTPLITLPTAVSVAGLVTSVSLFALGPSSSKLRFWPMLSVADAWSPSPSVAVAVSVIRLSAASVTLSSGLAVFG